MIKITLDNLIKNLLDDPDFTDGYRIYAKDGDNEFHMVTEIDILNNEIRCNDDWDQIFDSFREGHSKLYYEERE